MFEYVINPLKPNIQPIATPHRWSTNHLPRYRNWQPWICNSQSLGWHRNAEQINSKRSKWHNLWSMSMSKGAKSSKVLQRVFFNKKGDERLQQYWNVQRRGISWTETAFFWWCATSSFTVVSRFRFTKMVGKSVTIPKIVTEWPDKSVGRKYETKHKLRAWDPFRTLLLELTRTPS